MHNAQLNLDAVNQILGDVGPEAFEMLVDALIEEVNTGKVNLRRHFDDGNWRRLEVDAHALKSAARSFGAEGLANSCLAIEKAAEKTQKSVSGDTPDSALLTILDMRIEETIEALGALDK